MKLVIFDFDGVLVDTLLICYSINAKKLGFSLEKYKSFFGGNIYETTASVKNKSFNLQDFFKHYDNETRELKIPDELKKILKELGEKYILGIVSSTQTSSISNILKREGVASSFRDIFGSDTHTSKVVKNKMLLEKYKIESKDAVFVTDTVGDVIEARTCGIKSIAVTWGFHDEKMLLKAKPDKIVNTPRDLMKAIKLML